MPRFFPARILVLTFLSLIAAGTVLLSLPLAASGAPLGLVDALFTATSAVCVTGLIVVDTPHDLSLAGQLIVLVLIQLGGLGYMAITTVVAVALGRQLTVHERLTLQEALNIESLEDLAKFVLTVLKVTLVFELTGAVLLTLRFWGEFDGARAAYYGLFHAVSAFNNAGFALFSDSLSHFRGDWFVNAVVAVLVISGGLGFIVITELGRRREARLSAHTRLVLWTTTGLIVLATTFIFVVERHNPRTLGTLTASEALLAAAFQAITPRTAGFNTLDFGGMLPATLLMTMVLMFVGAAPGGTAGGIKVTTFSVTIAVLWAMVRGAPEATLLRRRIAPQLVARVLSISLIGFLALNLVAGTLLLVEGRDLLPTLFETTSAFGTVGLSMGEEGGAPVSLAGHFSDAGKLLVVLMMFAGRIGPLTLAVAIARGARPARIRYPQGRFLVG